MLILGPDRGDATPFNHVGSLVVIVRSTHVHSGRLIRLMVQQGLAHLRVLDLAEPAGTKTGAAVLVALPLRHEYHSAGFVV